MPTSGTKGVPFRIDPAMLAGEGLEEIPPWTNPPEGEHGHAIVSKGGPEWIATPFEGDIIVFVLEIDVGGHRKYQVVNVGFDQLIYVLEGTMILTPEEGEACEYNRCDFAIMPKGFTGTREYIGDVFRELSVIEADSWHKDIEERIGVEMPE